MRDHTPHTPGPWKTEWRHGHRVLVEYEDGDQELIARVSGPESNARLIAAAPEMLRILKGIEPSSGWSSQWFSAIQSVIAKAEGKKR